MNISPHRRTLSENLRQDRMRWKQIVSDICLQDFSLRRKLKIPEPAAPPETDVSNIQLAVLDLLNVDSELQSLTSSLLNLGLDISAFNTQKRVWDILAVDSEVYLPYGSSIIIICFKNTHFPISLSTQRLIRSPILTHAPKNSE